MFVDIFGKLEKDLISTLQETRVAMAAAQAVVDLRSSEIARLEAALSALRDGAVPALPLEPKVRKPRGACHKNKPL